MKISLYLALAAVLFVAQLPAQTTKAGRKMRETRQTAEDASSVITTTKETIESIFSIKKKAKKDVEEAVKENAAKEADKAIDKPQTGNAKNSSGLQPGDVHPNAKVIDAEILYPFNKGAAVVRKGTAYALINKNGDFIVPYNKYSFNEVALRESITWSQGGIFIVRSSDFTYDQAINYEGKLITGEYASLVWYLTNNRLMAYATDKNKNLIFMNAEGQKYILKHDPNYSIRSETFSEDAVVVWANNNSSKEGHEGFKNMKDEWIVKPKYDLVEPFSEGLARVAKKNEFGELKYGYINKEGKEVIGLIFSRRPDDFKGGLARVNPNDRTEFAEAYIDKKGNVVVKLNQVNGYEYMGDGLYIENSKSRNILNAEGNIIPANEFLKTYGVVLNASTDKGLYIADLSGVSKREYIGKVRFARSLKQSGVVSYQGFVDLETKKVVEGRFKGDVNSFVFDPVSRLATASFYIDERLGHKSPLREGYINEDGVFVIVKGEKSKW